MDYENVLRKIGDFGPYQLLIFFVLTFTALQTAMDLEFIIFMSYTPIYNCTDPSFLNVVNGDNFSTVVVVDQCSATFTNLTTNATQTIACSNWSYDQSQIKQSFVTEFNLICGREHLKTYTEMLYFAGVSVGMVLGSIGDHIGRRKVILLCSVWETFAMIATPLMPTVETIMLFRFLRGFAISMYYQGLSLVTEIVPMERRGLYGNNYWLFWSIGYMAIAGFGYLAPDWRAMKLYSCIPLVVYISFFFVIPESPRWLAVRGRKEDAIKVLKRIARRNRRPFPDGFFDNFISPTEVTGRFLDLFRTKNMTIKTLILWYAQTSISMCYFGLSISNDFASDNIFINIAILGLIELPCGIIAWIAADKLGRRMPSTVFMVATGVSIISVPFIPKGWIRVMVAAFGKFFLTLAYNIVDIYLAEIFPTTVRNMGVFSTATCASFGTILAPKINDLKATLYFLPNIIFTLISFICAALIILLLPETNNCPMPQTVKEADGLVRGREKEYIAQISSKENGISTELKIINEPGNSAQIV